MIVDEGALGKRGAGLQWRSLPTATAAAQLASHAPLLLAVLVSWGISGCGSQPSQDPHRHPVFAWPLSTLAKAEGERVGFAVVEDQPRWILLEPLRSAQAAAVRLLDANPGETPDLWVTTDPVPNAMAFRKDGKATIAITAGMGELLGDDEPAWAALIGHELAHLRLAHQQQAQSRASTVQAGSSAAAILLAIIGVPFAAAVADGAGEVVAKGFSRDDERAADDAGMAYAARAGYPVAGATRLFERLASVERHRGMTLLSTHPGIEERVARAREAQARESSGALPASGNAAGSPAR